MAYFSHILIVTCLSVLCSPTGPVSAADQAAIDEFNKKVEALFKGGTNSGGTTNVRSSYGECDVPNSECVPYFQCDSESYIKTDGADVIDYKSRPQHVPVQKSCNNPQYPEEPTICCQKRGTTATPTPLITCYGIEKCVEPQSCSNTGQVNTDGSGLIVIRLDQTTCFLPNNKIGVCCTPQFQHCPGNSVCEPHGQCVGTARNHQGTFATYDSTGTWSQCYLGPEHSGTGVCCISGKSTQLIAADKCGIRNYKIDSPTVKIQSNLANNEASFGEFPWQAIVFTIDEDNRYIFKCGASLISNQHVLTVAHNVDKLTASDIVLRLGEWQTNTLINPLPTKDIKISKIHLHPQYNRKNVHNDIAVLQLIEPVPIQFHINTICLPGEAQSFADGQDCFSTGWGKDSFQGQYQHILKKIDLPIVEHNKCQDFLRKTRLGNHFQLDDSFLCAGGIANKDACYGDGGGPLVCKSPSSDQYVLAGITSWGIGCGTQDIPGVYVNVRKFHHWIDDIVLGITHQYHNKGLLAAYGK